jgi:arginine N-succinyltransferase
MILLREIQERDLDALETFAQIPGMFNLPGDRDVLREKIMMSVDSFRDTEIPIRGKKGALEGKYLFVAEDTQRGKVLGTSMIAGQHGTVESPHFYFEVGNEEKFSSTINTGFIHGTLKLKYDTNGPSEIGGLVIDPDSRNSDARVGRQISFVRFLYLALNRDRFRNKILAELLPPLNRKGLSPLWEAIGRRFTNMDYWEADQLCAKDKEFIFSLFPSGKIYTTFLTAEARNAIGKVGKDTEPVLHMLKKVGFKYMNQVDPFDGGPHLWGNVEELLPVQNLKRGKISFDAGELAQPGGASLQAGLLSPLKQRPGQFRAANITAELRGDQIVFKGSDEQREEIESQLDLEAGDDVAFMSYY